MTVPTKRTRLRAQAASVGARAKDARDKHISVAVPFRAAERNRRVAASALAGGIAYRLFFWLIPFALLIGGALGFADAESTEEAIEAGGLPAAAANAVGDMAREAGSAGWWLLGVGLVGVFSAGYTGSKAVILIHALVWEEYPEGTPSAVRMSLAFTGMALAVMLTIATTSWLHEVLRFGAVLAAALTIASLAGLWLLVSLRLPHRSADWKALLPGAFLFGVGFALLHLATLLVLIPQLERSTSVYGAIGVVTTTLFWFYLVGRLVVTAPILNVATDEELQEANSPELDDAVGPGGAYRRHQLESEYERRSSEMASPARLRRRPGGPGRPGPGPGGPGRPGPGPGGPGRPGPGPGGPGRPGPRPGGPGRPGPGPGR